MHVDKPKSKKPWYKRIALVVLALVSALLLFRRVRNTKVEDIPVPKAEEASQSSAKAEQEIEKANVGPTDVEPTKDKSMEDLKKEYDSL